MASALRVQVSPSAYFLVNLTLISTNKQNNKVLSIVLISNGPGELTTWVKPIAEKLHNELLVEGKERRSLISLKLVLVPCPNATGKEKKVASQWRWFDQITAAKHFWKLLINPKKYAEWTTNGVVVFLGGDQFWSVLLSARLGYRNITYAEWVARWPQWNDRICAMSSKVKVNIPKKYRHKCEIVGDLMADLSLDPSITNDSAKETWIALMPGSKKAKLCIGVPFMLEVADRLKEQLKDCLFLLPIAPTTNIEEIKKLSTHENPIAKNYTSGIKEIIIENNSREKKKLITINGSIIHLEEETPAHLALSKCDLAITTIGANTSELGALCIPMIVIVPTQHMNVMNAWDGFLGLIARLPGIKIILSLLISKWRLKGSKFLAWPNISAGRMVVPEKVGKIFPSDIAKEASSWIKSPMRLKGQKDDLCYLRGKPGAVSKITKIILDLIQDYKY